MSKEINTLYLESKMIQHEISRLSKLISFSQERIRISEKALSHSDQKIKKIQSQPINW